MCFVETGTHQLSHVQGTMCNVTTCDNPFCECNVNTRQRIPVERSSPWRVPARSHATRYTLPAWKRTTRSCTSTCISSSKIYFPVPVIENNSHSRCRVGRLTAHGRHAAAALEAAGRTPRPGRQAAGGSRMCFGIPAAAAGGPGAARPRLQRRPGSAAAAAALDCPAHSPAAGAKLPTSSRGKPSEGASPKAVRNPHQSPPGIPHKLQFRDAWGDSLEGQDRPKRVELCTKTCIPRSHDPNRRRDVLEPV